MCIYSYIYIYIYYISISLSLSVYIYIYIYICYIYIYIYIYICILPIYDSQSLWWPGALAAGPPNRGSITHMVQLIGK